MGAVRRQGSAPETASLAKVRIRKQNEEASLGFQGAEEWVTGQTWYWARRVQCGLGLGSEGILGCTISDSGKLWAILECRLAPYTCIYMYINFFFILHFHSFS